MIKNFSIDYKPQIINDGYDVLCNGKPIQIVKWDCHGECPILGVTEADDGADMALFFTERGCTKNEKYWLQIVIPNNYNKFEVAIESLINRIDGDHAVFIQDYDPYIKEFAPIIMKAAEDLLREQTNGNYAWLVGKEQAYKNMPHWKKVKDGHYYDQGFTIDEYDDGRLVLCNKDYEIDIKELWEHMMKED